MLRKLKPESEKWRLVEKAVEKIARCLGPVTW